MCNVSTTLDPFNVLSLSCLSNLVFHPPLTTGPTHFILSRLIKEVFHVVDRNVFEIINKSLVSGVVPTFFKHAVVQPLLKKPNLDHDSPSNFRTISKLRRLFLIHYNTIWLRAKAFEWFTSYLSERTFVVSTDGVLSNTECWIQIW